MTERLGGTAPLEEKLFQQAYIVGWSVPKPDPESKNRPADGYNYCDDKMARDLLFLSFCARYCFRANIDRYVAGPQYHAGPNWS